MDDPLLVEVQSEDYWYEGYNMRTGARGIFPAYYAIEVTKDPESYKGTDTATIRGLTVSVLVKKLAIFDGMTWNTDQNLYLFIFICAVYFHIIEMYHGY